MDTIPRENNSYLPVAGVILGVVAIIISIVACAKISAVKKDTAAQIAPISSRLDDMDSRVSSANAAATAASANVNKLAGDTQTAFTAVAQQMGDIRGEIAKAQQAAPAAKGGKAAKGAHGAAVAGPGEYVIKSGDTFHKIAHANGVSVSDLVSVNPGVNAGKLHVGQKIKLPAKGGAAAAPDASAPAAQ